jgi:hypothetical protein
VRQTGVNSPLAGVTGGPSAPARRANENPDRVAYRRGFVTRHQVSGWRFVMRRIASGVALHDTRMLVDPLRTQSRAVLVGALILITGLAGCFVFSLIRPSGVAGNDAVLADRDTAALYVKVGDQLHPVLNLTSARLIAGRPDNPTTVKTSELDQFPRGNLLGIPGAPERMVQNTSRDADWTICDAAFGSAAGVTVIAGNLADGGERASALPANHAVLVENDGRPWLLWDGKAQRDRPQQPRRHRCARPWRRHTGAPPDRLRTVQRHPRSARADSAGHSRLQRGTAIPVAAFGTRRRGRRGLWRRRHDPLLRRARRRPATHLTGAGRDPAQYQLFWARPAAPAECRRGGTDAGRPGYRHRRLPAEIRALPSQDTWTALEFTGAATRPSVSAVCALRTGERPATAAPIPALQPLRGRHRAALDPLSTERLHALTGT